MNLSDVKDGLKVRTTTIRSDTRGMFIAPKNLALRRSNAEGVVRGFVPGHGGDVWWVEHEGEEFAPYCFDEFEPAAAPTQSEPTEA